MSKVSQLNAGECLWDLGSRKGVVKKISKAKLISSKTRQGRVTEVLIEWKKIFTVSSTNTTRRQRHQQERTMGHDDGRAAYVRRKPRCYGAWTSYSKPLATVRQLDGARAGGKSRTEAQSSSLVQLGICRPQGPEAPPWSGCRGILAQTPGDTASQPW